MTGGVWLLAALLSAGNAELERAANEGALEVAVGRERARLVSRGPASGELTKVMLSKPEAFVQANGAREAAWKVYQAMIEAECLTVARLAGERMGLTNASAVRTSFSAAELAAARKCFDERYPAERTAACVQQAATLVGRWRPSPHDFETQDEAALRREMCARVVAQQKMPVFEENLSYISTKIVEPIFDSAKKERKRQGDYLRRARSDGCAPSVLAAELTEKLLRHVEERQAKETDPASAWGVFPSVTNNVLKHVVRRRVMDRFVARISETPCAIQEDEIIRTLAADRAHHRKTEDSHRAFRRIWTAHLQARVIRAELDEAPERERQELKAYLMKNCADEAVVKAVGARMDDEFFPQLDAVRRKVAEAEFAEVWPMLADRTWWPDAETVDDVCARRDFTAVVRHWRDLPNVGLPKGESATEETQAMADKSVAAVFERARGALVAQMGVVDAVRPDVLDEVKKRKASFWHRTPDLEKIVALLTDAVLARWTATKGELLWPKGDAPANAQAQYAALFPCVRKRIELEAKAILNEISPPDPEEVPAEPVTRYSIVVSRQGDRVTVKLDSDGQTLFEKSPPAEMEAFRGVMKDVGEKLGKDILELP